MTTQEKLIAFVSREFAGGRTVAADTPLLGDLVDSVGTFVLVSFIEQEFGVALGDSDLTVDNLGTVQAIADLVAKRSSA